MNEKDIQHTLTPILTVNDPDIDCFDLDAIEAVLDEQSNSDVYKRAVKILEDLGCAFNAMTFMESRSDTYYSTYTTYKPMDEHKDESYAIDACFLPAGETMCLVSCSIQLLY